MEAQSGYADFKGRLGWAMFDWANQPYFTVVTTFIFSVYFVNGFHDDPVVGQANLGWATAIGGFMIAIVSPVIGAIADKTGARKPWIALFAVIGALGAAGLWQAVPGAPDGPWLVMGFFIVAMVGFEYGVVFNNAMLPSLVPSHEMGRLSGFGWGLGYVGGIMALGIVQFGLIGNPDWFGLDPALREAERITGPLGGLWYLVFLTPLFLWTPDVPRTKTPLRQAVREGLETLSKTLRHLRDYRDIVRFLIARMIYADGLSAIFAFGGAYAAATFDWEIMTVGIFGIILTLVAAIGAFVGGWMDDRLGSKKTLQIAVSGLVFSVFGSISVTAGHALFIIPLPVPAPDAAPLTTMGELIYLGFGCIPGLCAGPTQAASRTMLGRMAPPHLMTEFFGLYALSGKATAFLAPLGIAIATTLFASQRAGLFVVLAFLAVGLYLLSTVQADGRATKQD